MVYLRTCLAGLGAPGQGCACLHRPQGHAASPHRAVLAAGGGPSLDHGPAPGHRPPRQAGHEAAGPPSYPAGPGPLCLLPDRAGEARRGFRGHLRPLPPGRGPPRGERLLCAQVAGHAGGVRVGAAARGREGGVQASSSVCQPPRPARPDAAGGQDAPPPPAAPRHPGAAQRGAGRAALAPPRRDQGAAALGVLRHGAGGPFTGRWPNATELLRCPRRASGEG
jgi:hypothetical protein